MPTHDSPTAAAPAGAALAGAAPAETIPGAEVPTRYLTTVRVRWSDLDAFGHVNNARTVTLLEEARVDWLFLEAERHGVSGLSDGIVVSRLDVHYRRPIMFGPPVQVSMGLTALRAVSATIDYLVHADGELAVTASTQLVPVDPSSFRPRRWTTTEHAFLAGYVAR